MNVLLIYPQYPDTFWSFKHVLPYVSKKATFPPLGLLTVAAMLPDEWQKKLVDVNVKKLTDKEIAWADMVMIGAMLIQKDSALEIVARCKAQGKVVVGGGPAFTTQHDLFPDVDHFFLNEAETTLPVFLEDLKKGQLKRFYSAETRPDITKTPIPLWSLINPKDYVSMSIQYSRGCPFNCEFCDIVIMNGRVPRTKTPEQMIREFQAIYDAGWRRSVFVVDDNFIGNKSKVKEVLKQLGEWQKKHNYPFKLMTEASVNLAEDEELMRLMSAANFNKVFLGIETPCDNSLKECDKLQNTNLDLGQAVKTIHHHGMQVMGGFIVGFDSDTESIFERQINFIQKIGVVSAMVGMLTPLPKTRLWERLEKEGRLLTDTKGENTEGVLSFIPRMNKDDLIEGYKKIIATIFSREKYYERINTFIKAYKPRARGKIHFDELKTFAKGLWGVGVRSRARNLFWKTFLKTFFTKIRAIPEFVEMAICGLHFEKCAERICGFNAKNKKWNS